MAKVGHISQKRQNSSLQIKDLNQIFHSGGVYLFYINLIMTHIKHISYTYHTSMSSMYNFFYFLYHTRCILKTIEPKSARTEKHVREVWKIPQKKFNFLMMASLIRFKSIAYSINAFTISEQIEKQLQSCCTNSKGHSTLC